MTMTMNEVRSHIATAPGRTHVLVCERGSEYVAKWEDVEYKASNPFALDSLLTVSGVPEPRNLYLVSELDFHG